MIQLVNENGLWNYEDEIPASTYTVSVLGSQSSGKSTLLNNLFSTNFQQLNAKIERKRCTQGIWLQKTTDCNVIDTEGTDSNERESTLFENYTALFCLLVSDIFIINLWCSEVGRYSGAHMDIFKCLFSASFKVFNNPKKILMFVVKDFTPSENKLYIQNKLTDDVNKIWNDITENKKYSPFEKYFGLDFFFMSSYRRELSAYKEQALKLKKQIAIKSRLLRRKNNIPQESLTVFYKNLWEKIKTDTQINIVDQRNLILSYCCTNIKRQCLNNLEIILQELDTSIPNYRLYLSTAKNMSVEYYRHSVLQPQNLICMNVEYEMLREVQTLMENKFESLQRKMQAMIFEDLQNSLAKLKINYLMFEKIMQRQTRSKQLFRQFLNGCKEESKRIYYQNFQNALDCCLAKYKQDQHRYETVFKDQCLKSFISLYKNQIDRLTFSSEEFEKSYRAKLKMFYPRGAYHFCEDTEYQRILLQSTEQILEFSLLQKLEQNLHFNQFAVWEDRIVKYFKQLEYRFTQGFLKQISRYLETKEINSLINLEKDIVSRIEKQRNSTLEDYRKNKFILTKPILFLIGVFAYSEISILLAILFPKQVQWLFRFLYFAAILIYTFLL